MKLSIPFIMLLGLAGQLNATPLFQVVALPTLGGGGNATAINNSGAIVGTIADTNGNFSAAVWQNGSLISLQGLPQSFQQYGAGINSQGVVVGTGFGTGGPVPLQWSGGTPQALGAAYGFGQAINDAGDVAGMWQDAQGNGRAFKTEKGAFRDLGSLPGSTWAAAYGINSQGDVVGYSETASGAMRGFVWRNGRMEQIGTFGGTSSYAAAINDRGQVAGSALNAAGNSLAFLYSAAGLQSLGTLGGSSSYAYGINQAGAVVGSSWSRADDHLLAFLFVSGVMLDLNSLLPPDSGWQLQSAQGINDLGQIVGMGLYHGKQMPFLLQPYNAGLESPIPEPGTLPLCLLAGSFAAGYFGWRRRRAR